MKRVTILLAAFALIISARGQNFTNLNFESAFNLPGNPAEQGTLVSVTNALPDWTVYSGPAISVNAISSIYYLSNGIAGGRSAVELEGGTLALSGNNLSVELFLNSAIGQTGVVPANAGFLEFEAGGSAAGGSYAGTGFTVTLGGDILSLLAITEGPNYTVYGANIPSNLDGQPEPLIFSCLGIGSGQVELDDVAFLPGSVPEPSAYALLGLGAVAWIVFRRRRRPGSSTLFHT